MFFLSSPPQPPPQLQFFNNPFAFPHSPNTPSPLCTSYNANGVKRSRMSDQQSQSQPHSSPLRKSGNIWSAANDTENNFSDSTVHASTTPVNCSFSSPFSTTTTTTTTTSNAGSTPNTQPVFSFESRARASSPAYQLSARSAANKAQNKARFLDRLRTRRDERTGWDDKVLRADYLGERRAWEEEMARRARLEEDGGGVDETEDVGMEEEVGEGEGGQRETGEKEIEALIALLEGEDEEYGVAADGVGDEGDSQEWDEVFMVVLSQQEPQMLSQDVDQGGRIAPLVVEMMSICHKLHISPEWAI